jgi:hypothetical protein
MKKIAILQSNYIPWKGYFDMIASVDEFILYDDMQFTKNDWRNRNQIKTPNGLQWLSVPVGQDIRRRIRDVSISDSGWQKKHWQTLRSNYARAQYFDEVAVWLEPIYLGKVHHNLSSLNRSLIEAVCAYLEFSTVISNSWDYDIGEGKSERLVRLCQQAGAGFYLSGPAARSYLDAQMFKEAGIGVEWFDYSGYRNYSQLWGEFAHGVTILDLLFNCGKAAPRYMKFGGGDVVSQVSHLGGLR